MYWLIETDKQIEYLIARNYQEAFIEIIPLHNNIHPAINDVSLVYFKPSIEQKGFMLCVDHSETLSISKTRINELLQTIDRVWVRDKKNALYYFQIKSLLDLNLITNPYIPEPTQAHNILYQKNPNKKDINKIVPIVKHYEVCENIYDEVKHAFKQELPPYFDFYNNYTTLAFFGIEKNGIKIDETVFEQHFNPNNAIYSIADGKIYTSYNLFTTTKRPSNSFNGVNFAALNKETGARKSFIPQNDEFVELDISAYHPHLASHLVTFDFGDKDVHQTFANLYGTSYKEAKELTFKQLYGGVFKEYEHLEFFQQVKKFIDNNWKDYNELGKVVVPKSGYWFENSKLDNMNPQKLFNYILQNLESSTNVCILMHIHKILRGKKTKIVLYTYDSFLFDFANDEQDVLEEIKQIFKQHKLSIKSAHGISYDFTGS
jgi:hypothetical protein